MASNARHHEYVLLLFSGVLLALASSQTVHKMSVRSDVRFRFATTEMLCVMGNDMDAARELKFDVTLPKDAFIANFSMEIEGKQYPGNVKEKQKAKEQYEHARRSGHSGGLVEQSARHSNKFDVSVNIAAGSNVTFTLIYQELLRRRFGVYEHSIYINNKTLDKIRDYSIEIYIQDRNEIRDVRTPAMRKEITNNAVEERQNTITQISNPTANTVYVVYRPTIQELKEQGPGWFVVQYDVDSDLAGELLVVDGYFVHFFVPPDGLPPLPLDIVFVLDISGSMAGRKLQQMKDAMRVILDDLRETDRFNILLFDGSVQRWEQSLQEASESNIGRGQDYVKAINYRGSTNLHLALMKGLEMLQGSREDARVPMIFFLTDGEATSGVQDSNQIVADVSRKNEGVVNIYSLAFGAGADYKLLRQVSAKNGGFARKIYEASDASDQVSGLYREISTIVIRGLTVSYHSTSNNDDGDDANEIRVDNRTVTICVLPTVFGKSDFVVAGKLENADSLMRVPEKAGGLKLAVSGLGAKQKINFVLEENDLTQLTLDGDNPFWTVPRDLSKMAERAWAFLLIKQLLKEKVAAQEEADLVKELDKRILDLSLKYHFVTPLTSMVVTRPEDEAKKSGKVEASFTDDDDVPASQSHTRPLASYQSQGSQVFQSVLSPMGAANIPRLSPGLQGPSSQDMFAYSRPSHPRGVPSRRQYSGGGPSHPRGVPSRRHYIGGGGGRPAVSPSNTRPYRQRKKMKSEGSRLPPMMMTTTRTGARTTTTTMTTTTRTTMTKTTASTPPPPTTTTRAPLSPKQPKKKRNMKKDRKDRKGKKKMKTCKRVKKVILHYVTARGHQTPVNCYELIARRQPQNYTLFSDLDTKYSVVVTMRKRFMTALHVGHDKFVTTVVVNSQGDLTFIEPSGRPLNSSVIHGNQSLKLDVGQYTVTVNITRKTCRVSVITVDIDAGTKDANPALLRSYSGVAAKAYRSSQAKSHSKSRKRKDRSSRVCRAMMFPADRSFVVKGKKLLRYKA